MKKLSKLIISTVIASGLLLNTINTFAQGQVRVSVGNKTASVNGKNVTLNVAPYIQQPSESMMIPLRFVSTGLGIDESNIKYIPITKEIIIAHNGNNIKFVVGSSKMTINGESFDMVMKDRETGKEDYIYTEIKNGSTFIPLRALETGLGVKIDWENSTKTAILTNELTNEDVSTNKPVIKENTNINQDTQQNNTNISNTENNFTEDSSNKKLTEQEIRAMEEEVVRLVNEERAKYGLQPLEISEELMQIARLKSEDMLNNNYYEHISPIYGSPFDMLETFNISYSIAGENIHHHRQNAKSVVESWLSSEGHRENILNDNFKYIGVGLSGAMWTQMFIG